MTNDVSQVFTALFIVAAVKWSIAHTRDNNAAGQSAEPAMTASSSVPVFSEVQTAYGNATTIVYATILRSTTRCFVTGHFHDDPVGKPCVVSCTVAVPSVAPSGEVPLRTRFFLGAWVLI